MPFYRYRAISESGASVSGKELAQSADALRSILNERGLLPQRIVPVFSNYLWGSRLAVTNAKRLEFARYLRTLLRAGLTVVDALTAIADESEDNATRATVRHVLDVVRNGKSLSQACASLPDVFDEFFVATLEAGETAGNLPMALSGYAVFLERHIEFTTRIRQAMIYPIFLLATLSLILVLMFVFILPRFVGLYADLGVELPFATRLLVSTIDLWPVLVVGLLFIAVGVRWIWPKLRVTSRYIRLSQRWKHQIPVIGPFLQSLWVAKLAEALGMLIEAGMPILNALKTYRDGASDPATREQLDAVIDHVRSGKSLTQALRTLPAMPATALTMFRVGEDAGQIASMCGQISQLYQERINHSVKKLSTLIEPSLILAMGVIVGFVLVAMYLPIFSVMEFVQ